MTLFEILNFNRELLDRLAGTGYKPDDYKYIDLYREYELSLIHIYFPA